MSGGDEGGASVEATPTASLHILDVRLATLRRLLDRRDGDGTLVQADRALIEAAIEAARRDLSGVRDLLATVPNDPTDPYRATAEVMTEAVAELDRLLDALDGSVRLKS